MKLTNLILAGALTGALAACGGGGSDTTPALTSMTVTPSLGKFSAGTQVKLNKPDGTELSTGTITSAGTVTLKFSGYTGPAVIEVLGGAGVTYYDEGTNAPSPFIAGKKLRAVMPALLAQIGVTALTNAAVAKLEAAGSIASASATQISDANAKVAAVFGLADILQAPTAVGSLTDPKLSVAKLGDKYALVLAALAKTAGSGKQAADVADALALDLKDDKLDGLNGTTAITTYSPGLIAARYDDAATELADASSKLLIKSNPFAVNTDVSKVVAVSNQSDVNLAKAMFTELRTTLNSFSNAKQNGFLDTQATRVSADMQANVAPEMSKVAGRISALGNAVAVYDDAKANGSTNGLTVGVDPSSSAIPAPAALISSSGSLQAVWYGYGSYDYCWTDSATASTISKVTCQHAGSDSADRANSRIKMVIYVITKDTASNQYSYTATRYNKSVTQQLVFPFGLIFGKAALVTTDSAGNTVPKGSGTITKTDSTTLSGIPAALTLTGTLPPSASNGAGVLTTGVDTIAITAARTNLTVASNFHYALSGSVSTSNLADPAKVVTLSIDTGSYIDMDESSTVNGPTILAAKLAITAQTVASKFTGTVEATSFMNDKDGFNYSPTSLIFTGSISDTSTGGAGQILTGKLAASVADYQLYHGNQPDTASNYLHATLSFTGTVQAPGRPLLTLVLAGVKTGLNTTSLTLNYSYGVNSITGSGLIDSANSASDTLTLSNQDGIQVVISKASGTVNKSNVKLATITNGFVNYIDGVTQSLN